MATAIALIGMIDVTKASSGSDACGCWIFCVAHAPLLPWSTAYRSRRHRLDGASLYASKMCQGERELWLVADCSDLRKPYATEMPYLMQVPALDGKGLVPGYRTLNVLGITPGRRGILYHRLLSSQAPGFVSEPAEVQEALETVSAALRPLKANKTITWITDRGFDDVAVWRTIWEQKEHVLCRIYHTERTVAIEDGQGHWIPGNIA